MPSLGQDNFEAGWTPVAEGVNAPVNGLLRASNMTLDERGALVTKQGKSLESEEFGTNIENIYSLRLYESGVSKRFRYLHFRDGSVKSTDGTDGATTYSRDILSGGNDFVSAFNNALGYVLVLSGEQKVKDDGQNIRDLGIPAPTEAPQITTKISPYQDIIDNYGGVVVFTEDGGESGTISAASNKVTVAPNTDSGRVILHSNGFLDLSRFDGPSGELDLTNRDVFRMRVTSSKFASETFVTVNFLTVPRTAAYDESELINKFTKTFVIEGRNITENIEAFRDEFTKEVYPDQDDVTWENITQVEVIVTPTSPNATDEITISNLQFISGVGNLTGTYQWVQVNVFKNPDTGIDSLSPIGIESEPLQLENQNAYITPQIPDGFGDNITQIWVFRRELRTFDTYYRTEIREDGSEFPDSNSDIELIGRIGDIEQIDDNRIVIPYRIDWFVEHPPDNCVACVGPYFTRVIYITENFVYFSRPNDPDAVDSRHTIDISGNTSERNLWGLQVGDSSVLIGTTHEIYDITGTGLVREDNTTDLRLRPRGIDHPPIARHVAKYSATAVYMSNSGWRLLEGSVSRSITGNTDQLYYERDLHGFDRVFISTDLTRKYAITTSRNKLYCSVWHDRSIPNTNNREKTLLIYDFDKRVWLETDEQVHALFTEDDNTILAAYQIGEELSATSALYSLDRPENITEIDDDILVRTPFLDGGFPNSRKDTETLNIYANSQAQVCKVYLYVDGNEEDSTRIFIGDASWNGPSFNNFDIESIEGIPLGKNYALEIVGENLTKKLQLFNWSINFTPRPEQKNYLRVPPTNFGVAGRKRFYDLPFSVDPLGDSIDVTPVLDGVELTSETVPPRNYKTFHSIAFAQETIGHELGLHLRCQNDNGVFEFYELIQPRHTELLPDLQKFHHIPFNNLGTPAKKRFIRFAFIIDTRGNDIIFTPNVDGITYIPEVYNTSRKQTVVYYFKDNVEGVDIGGTLTGGKIFELYGIDFDETLSVKLPTPTEYLLLCTDFHQAARKRFERLSFVLNTRGGEVRFKPILDGIEEPAILVSNNNGTKQTFNYFFKEAKHFVNLCYELKALDGIPFEFWELVEPERLELLPEPLKFFPIPATNLGNDKRKRFIAYAIVIDTFGANTQIELFVDGVSVDSSTFSTDGKDTYIHYFDTETTGRDIRAEICTLADTPFEFYEINFDETISETMPAPARHLVIPPSNLGIPARKRIRTIPFTINTRGNEVTFTPTADGVAQIASTHTTTEKRTVFHYFEKDLFATDLGFTLDQADSGEGFEFYGIDKLLNVQTIPVGRKWDQVGPIEARRVAFMRRMELRCIATGTLITYRVFNEDVEIDSGSIITTPDVDKRYSVDFMKGVQFRISRIEFESAEVFHRYHVHVWHSESGGGTDFSVVKFGETEA